MECSIIHCKKKATEFYKLRDSRFGYCKKHTAIQNKIIINTKKGR